jgi:hypothetical protein
MDSDAKEFGHVHAPIERPFGQVAASDWANDSKREADQHRLSTDENGHAPTDIKT